MKTIIGNLEVEIFIKINEKKFMLAQCSLTIKGIGEIRGYRVMQSNYGDKLNVLPPAPNSMPAYHLVRLEPQLWEEVMRAIKQAYLETKETYYASSEHTVDIDPDEIPI